MLELNKVHRMDALTFLKQLDDESVDFAMTSPPYFNLRMYLPKNHPDKPMEIGQEDHPQKYIDKLVEIFMELKRVLKKTGNFYLNIGDCYASDRIKGDTLWGDAIQPQQLLNIPHRLAIELQKRGWILRNSIIWKKGNPMPCSVKRRLNTTYEMVFHFVKDVKRYYYDLDAIRVPHMTGGVELTRKQQTTKQIKLFDIASQENMSKDGKYKTGYEGKTENVMRKAPNPGQEGSFNEAGKNPGDTISTKYNGTGYGGEGSGFKGHSGYYDVDGNLLLNPLGKNPGDVIERKPYAVQERDKEFVEYRNVPQMDDLKTYLNDARKKAGLTIDQVEAHFGTQAPHHWFNGESYPPKEDWAKLKDLLSLDSTYDEAMTKVFLKPAEKMNYPEGKNPGDVLGGSYLSPKYSGTEGHTSRQGLNRELSYHEQRVHEVVQKQIAKYLKDRVGPFKKELDETFGEHKWRHWIRDDYSGACLPGPDEWVTLKEIIGFDDAYDRIMTEKVLVDNSFQFSNKGKNPGDFWLLNTKPFNEAHFAVYPESLVEPPIRSSCPQGGVVLDMFAGAGTTLCVAKRMGMKYIGSELNEEFIKIINKRLAETDSPLTKLFK